jgi:type II secretory pathway component PulJ
MIPLSLLRSPLAIGGLVAVVLFVAAYQAGGNAERKRGEAAALRTELATLKADNRNAEAARDSEAAKAAALEALANRQETELDALRTQLNALPADDRQLAPSDALDRLYPKPR